jgi:hypothetical protein
MEIFDDAEKKSSQISNFAIDLLNDKNSFSWKIEFSNLLFNVQNFMASRKLFKYQKLIQKRLFLLQNKCMKNTFFQFQCFID